jgi:hypothetical protein
MTEDMITTTKMVMTTIKKTRTSFSRNARLRLNEMKETDPMVGNVFHAGIAIGASNEDIYAVIAHHAVIALRAKEDEELDRLQKIIIQDYEGTKQ